MIPHNRASMTDGAGRPTRDWYDWFRRLGELFAPGTNELVIGIDDLSDTAISGITDGQPLVWDNTIGRWLNGQTITFTPTTTPSSPVAGMVYYDSGTNKLRCYNGTIWNDLF